MRKVGKNNFTGNGNWDLKVLIKVGTLGFKRTEVFRAGRWGPDTDFWVDNDATQVQFFKLNKLGAAQLVTTVNLT